MKIAAHNARAYVAHCDALEILASPASLRKYGSGAAILSALLRIDARATRQAVAVCNVAGSPTPEETAPAIVEAVRRVLGDVPRGMWVECSPYPCQLRMPAKAAPAGLLSQGGESFLAPRF